MTQGFGDRRQAIRSSDPAVTAFLYLGQKLALLPSPAAPTPGKEHAIPEEASQVLLRAIEGDIIPRLLLAHRTREASAIEVPASAAALGEPDHARFLELVLNDTAASTRGFVAELLSRGVPEETIFLDLLATAARRLGELWEEDRCSFTEVTIGLCRLHEVLREHSSIHGATGREISGEAPQVLLATACGDQHVFGVVMVAEFFRRAGWRVWSEPGALCHQLATLLGQVHFDLLGLSAHCSTLADDIASEIESLREASCNARLRILVGGRLFLDEPDLVSRVGADGCAHDASSAPLVANELLAGSGALSY
jgi:methanogenic corrinoid protein MtbC1